MRREGDKKFITILQSSLYEIFAYDIKGLNDREKKIFIINN